MINYDSILSVFDGKPTLLQWLKMVKKALDESILKSVDITQNGEKVVFTFNFEDGTSIRTPEVTLPKGDTGATGPKGNDGVSITGIDTVRNEVVGDETLTTLRANYSNDTSNEFVVTAKNGKDAAETGGNIYTHCVKLSLGNSYVSIKVYSKKDSLTMEDALSQIPSTLQIPVYYFDSNSDGVLSAQRLGGSIGLRGIVYDNNSKSARLFSGSMTPKNITDELMGTNL